MPLTKFTNSKIIAGTRTATKRTPAQQAARDRLANAYKQDAQKDCPTCGCYRNHSWDGTAYICGGCGSVAK